MPGPVGVILSIEQDQRLEGYVGRNPIIQFRTPEYEAYRKMLVDRQTPKAKVDF